jgi:hypothetical protein
VVTAVCHGKVVGMEIAEIYASAGSSDSHEGGGTEPPGTT